MAIELDNGKPSPRPLKPGEPWRDGRGNYRMTTPEGDLRSYTRTTTVAECLDDNYKLDRWHSMMVAKGLGQRQDLVDLAAGHDIDADRSTYETIIDEAAHAAEQSAAANWGMALHRFTELADQGEPLASIPAEWHGHVLAYQDTLARFGLEVVAIESIVGIDDQRIAGTIDRVVRLTRDLDIKFKDKAIRLAAGTLIIGDLKTGKRMDFGRLKFCIQVTIYANHDFVWLVDHDHPQGGTRADRHDVDLEVGLIIHLPASDPAANAYVHWVDLTKGHEAYLAALHARRLRSQAKHMITESDDSETPVAEAMGRWLRERMQVIGNEGDQAVADLRYQWPLRAPDGSMIPLPKRPTEEQFEAVSATLGAIEAHYQIGFPPAPPNEPDEGANWLASITNQGDQR